jgi:hypothetical protein
MWLILNSCFLSLPVMADIVYNQVNVQISGNGIIKIDLNHDGQVDMSIVASATWCFRFYGPIDIGSVYVVPSSGAGAQSANGSYIVALSAGTAVNATKTFYSPEGLMVSYDLCPVGPPPWINGAWRNVTNHYLGIKFHINGQVHYGWARLNVTIGGFGPVVTLTGYAYETIVGHGITAGQTSGT